MVIASVNGLPAIAECLEALVTQEAGVRPFYENEVQDAVGNVVLRRVERASVTSHFALSLAAVVAHPLPWRAGETVVYLTPRKA